MIKYLKIILGVIREHPEQFFLTDKSFVAYLYFFNGVFTANFHMNNDRKFELEFARFVNQRTLGKEISSVPWEFGFVKKYSEHSDNQKKEILLQMLEEFCGLKMNEENG